MRILAFCNIWVLFLSVPSLQAESQTGYRLNEHPRIFVNRNSLSTLAARSQNELKNEYAKIKAVADSAISRGVVKPTGRYQPSVELICLGIGHLLEQERRGEATPYAEAVKAYWGDGQVLGPEGDGFFGYHAMVFDWIFDALSPAERRKYGEQLGKWLYWYTDTPEITLKNGDWRYNQTWGPAHLNTPNTRDGIAPKLFVALALAGGDTIHEEASHRFLKSWAKRVPDECISSFDEMGGVWSESMGHGGYGPVIVIPWAFEAWRTATGEDLFQQFAPDSYLPEMTRWAVYLTVPFSGHTAWIDDNRAANLSKFAQVAPILGARYHDPVANWISTMSAEKEWNEVPWNRFLSYDPSVPPSPPLAQGYPLAHHFAQSGHVYMLGAWEDPDATWAFFGAGPKFAGHSRDDEGHFLIARKGWLALRAGGSGHNDWDYYAGGSLAFNILTIYDPNEEFRRTTPQDPEGAKNENDGGMIRFVYSAHTRDDRADIVAFHHTKAYTYAAADLSVGYTKQKAHEVTRQFVYLREPSEFFVIFDRVEASQPDFPKHWFLHVPSEPDVRGEETVMVPDHVYVYAGDLSASWKSDPAGEVGTLSSGSARAFLTTLLPTEATMVKRGGEGHEFWGHPDEPTAQYNHVSRRSHLPPYVDWRLEVAAPEGNLREYFLNVIQVADSGPAAPITLLDEDGYKGVRVEVGGGIDVTFAAEGKPVAKIKVAGEAVQTLQSTN